MLTHTDPDFMQALDDAFGNTEWQREMLHTGGGCMVARLFQSNGSEIWITRDAEDWIVGFYNFVEDEDDQGICVNIKGHRVYGANRANGWTMSTDDPAWVAGQVFGILERL